MRRSKGLILCSVIIAAVAAVGQQTAPTAQQGSPAAAREVPGISDYRFAWDLNEQGNIRQILVYRNGQQVQALDLCNGGEPVKPSGEVGGLTSADFNFDNHPDLAMLRAQQREEKNLYCVWLFDPQKQRFVLAEEVSQIPNPQPDQQTKTIVSFVKENCAGGCFEQTSYAWAGGHLKPISYLGRALDLSAPPTSDCRFVRTMKQEKNGKLVETDRQRVDTGGNQCFEPRR